MQPIAAPVPSPPPYENLPRYRSEFLARSEDGWTRLEQAFGRRFGWMAAGSHSGFNAPRAHLARFLRANRARLFSEVTGPHGNPATTLNALKDRRVELVALDGFYLDLLRRHEPHQLEGLRTLATTDWMPIPLLVAAHEIDRGIVGRLRDHLVAIHGDSRYTPLLEATLLRQFALPDAVSYGVCNAVEEEAVAAGYTEIR
jgi:ABC-type phosphate/phosphonate transport system substrate-binding protein